MSTFRITWLASILAVLSAYGDSKPLYFEKDVRPILKAHCFHCHGEQGEREGGLDLRLVRLLREGGKSGPAIVPGKPGESLLFEMVQSGEMPEGKPRLPESDIATIERWIANGAPTARPEPEELGPGPLFTEEERSWWSLQPIVRPAVPATGEPNPIDAFIVRRLDEKGLAFSPEATRRVLLRRAHFALTGLPPSPREVEEFSDAPDFPALVDRLLASPSYGERWARHWLDVAGYADSEGYDAKDPERPHAWRYRDYVIRSFNEGKPFDQFVREQLAGDEIAAREKLHANAATRELRERYENLLAATGFLRMAPDGTAVKSDITTRNDCISSTLEIVGTALLGMTVHCAQCHDHRYDPISQADYYRLRAVFEPGFDVPAWRPPNRRLVSLQTKEEAAAAAEIERKAKAIDEERLVKQKEFIAITLENLLGTIEGPLRAPLREAFQAPAAERSPEQKKLLDAHPKVRQLTAGSLYLYDTTFKTKHAATLKEFSERAAEIRKTKPEIRYVRAFTEVPKKPEAIPATHVFFRGLSDAPKEKVAPSDLTVLGDWRDVTIPENDEALASSGRRLAFAEMLTDGEHPLVARVIANRVWMHHFGTGLVRTAGDFGLLGETPSHPELLDWLAADFMENGWDLKRLHRLILTSRTWKQQSLRTSEGERIDPDNRLLSRQNVRRLEAETLRDAKLAVAGKLTAASQGKPMPVMITPEGAVVLGVDTTDSAGRPTNKFVPLGEDRFRRSIYVQIRRSRPLEIFEAFDAPAMTDPNCNVRPVTTVSPQSLLLMNNAAMRQSARFLAERIRSEGGPDADTRIDYAWQLAYARDPLPEEAESARAFLEVQTAYYREHPAPFEVVSGPAEKEAGEPELLALAALSQALLSANEFLYID